MIEIKLVGEVPSELRPNHEQELALCRCEETEFQAEKREENQVQTRKIGACLACAWKEGRLMWWTHVSKSGKWRPEN